MHNYKQISDCTTYHKSVYLKSLKRSPASISTIKSDPLLVIEARLVFKDLRYIKVLILSFRHATYLHA